jgi:hypothetical protein
VVQGNASGDAVVLLNVPMDGETPGGRLLRPQAHAQEALIRNFVSTFVYRMDLRKGRSADPNVRKAEGRLCLCFLFVFAKSHRMSACLCVLCRGAV